MTRKLLCFLPLFFCSAAFAQNADITAVILASPTADARLGILWKIDVINNGPGTAHGVVVTGWSEPTLGTACSSTFDTIYGDSHAVMTCYTDPLGHAGTITLRSHVDYPADAIPENNDHTRTIQVIAGGPDLTFALNVPLIDPGLPFDVALRWGNGSSVDATNVTATVELPHGVSIVRLPDTCSAASGTITCAIGTVPAFKDKVVAPDLTFTARADDSTNGQILRFTGNMTAGQPEGDLDNNTPTVDARVYRTFFITDTGGNRLPDAVDQANRECTDGYPCKIAFRIPSPPASGYFTIQPSRGLAPVTAYSISIDGSTQTRFFGDTNPDGPEIFIDGSDAGSSDAIVIDEPCAAEIGSLAIGNYPNTAITIHGRVDSPHPAGGCSTTDRSIHDNYLGVDPTGTHAAPNERGIVFDEVLYEFDATSVERNVISGNRRSGIWIGIASFNKIAGNRIGLDIHNQALGNGASGIFVGPRASDIDIRGNYIAFNHDFGVAVARQAQGTDIGPNSIFANWQIGIDVGLDGPTPKSDVPAPDILSAQYDPATDTTVIVVATSEPTANRPSLTLYASDAPHPSGYGDGQYLIGILLKFDPRQNVTFTAKGDWRGKWVTGTVTRNFFFGFLTAGPAPTSEFPDTHSTTSEFSRAVKVE